MVEDEEESEADNNEDDDDRRNLRRFVSPAMPLSTSECDGRMMEG